MGIRKIGQQQGPPAGDVPQIVERIINTAIQMGASDIHISRAQESEPSQSYSKYLVRLRVQGQLQVIPSQYLNNSYNEVIARIKLLAKMDTTIKNKPQDGMFNITIAQNKIVLRVSIIPGFHEVEEVCIRLQKSSEKIIKLEEMVMTQRMQEQLKTLIHQKSGLFLVNGPAGSGKTTTIYSILSHLAGPNKKIITAEDPVEKVIDHINHNQVNDQVSFTDLSRAFMRQDAEVIFIGEIRDADSAQIAMQLAQTGHLVFSTVHTRDAIGVIARFKAFGVSPSFISSVLVGSLAQRLVPLLCSGCRQPTQHDEQMLERLNRILAIPEGTQFFDRGKGCSHCSPEGTLSVIPGYLKRLPIFELFVVDTEVGDMISHEAHRSEIQKFAQSKGMLTLAEEALLRYYQGFVDFESIRSLVFSPRY